ERPARMIDVGTGSGILAIAAARLGVGAVLAIDDDPDAVACAMANAARNHVADRVRCALADAAALREPRVPLPAPHLLSPGRPPPARRSIPALSERRRHPAPRRYPRRRGGRCRGGAGRTRARPPRVALGGGLDHPRAPCAASRSRLSGSATGASFSTATNPD